MKYFTPIKLVLTTLVIAAAFTSPVNAQIIIINPVQTNSNQRMTIRPTSQAGNYWVYQKPANVSEDQMNAAGAGYYSSPQACSMNYSLCTTLGGVWLSQQQTLVIQNSFNPPANPQLQTEYLYPSNTPPKTDTELYLSYYRECMDRSMYRTLAAYDRAIAINGYNMGYRYGEKPQNLTDEQMQSAGLNWHWSFQSWIGSQQQVKIPKMSSTEASQLCQKEVQNIRP